MPATPHRLAIRRSAATLAGCTLAAALAACSTSPDSTTGEVETLDLTGGFNVDGNGPHLAATFDDPFVEVNDNPPLDNEPVVAGPYAKANAQVGVTTTPTFSMYGTMPNSRSTGQNHNTVPDATENIKQVTFTAEGVDFDPCVTPDGNSILFASTRHRPTADIYLKSIAGTAVTQLTSDPSHDVMPAVSPDGRRVAFASNRNGSWDIYVMNIEGGQAVQLTFDSAHELHPTWSPDGSTIAYCRLGETSDRWEIWVVDFNRPASLKYLTYGLFPEWQPSGNKILFQRSRDRGDRYFSVWTVEYTAGEAVRPTEIASSTVAAIINPTWSQDGSYVAFSTVFHPDEQDQSDKPEYADIWIQAIDGSSRTNLTGGWFVNLMPTWGNDGKIYFISDRSGIDNIWAIGPEQAITASGKPLPRFSRGDTVASEAVSTDN